MTAGSGPAARLLSSPRRRRRLRRGAAAVALVGVCTFVGIHYSNTAKREEDRFTAAPVQRVAAPPAASELSASDRRTVQDVAARFIDTAVLRRRVDDSWALTTPKLRQGLSRREWDSGNIPVTPFPAHAVRAIKYRVDWSGRDLVYLKIAIVPKAASNVDGQAFDIGLTRHGPVESHEWLVDYWVPSGVGVPAPSSRRARAIARETFQEPKSRIPAAWIFVPVGALVVAVLGLPLAIFGRHWLRGRRALRAYQRERA